MPGTRSAVLKSSSQRRGTRGTVTPSLNEPVTYPASVCCLLSKEGTAHISGFHFLPLSLPTAQALRWSLNFRAQFWKSSQKAPGRGPGGGEEGTVRNPTPNYSPLRYKVSLAGENCIPAPGLPRPPARASPRPSVRPPARGPGPRGTRAVPRPAPRRALPSAPTGDALSCPGPARPVALATNCGDSAA